MDFSEFLKKRDNVILMFGLLVKIEETGAIPLFEPGHEIYQDTTIQQQTQYDQLIDYLIPKFVRHTDDGYKINITIKQTMKTKLQEWNLNSHFNEF